ncbi:PilZ domain-containing protein [Devosia sp.]|uniref:PilZ domain-containing protein n=1 Tax=Devosia sp. TaxID=1871048 RepID=UPI0027347DA2|nr:PilZ domain-containing protein [Devosia sp.]MDP2780026.1 PilZ domain-containing protein [Devosia sp.]
MSLDVDCADVSPRSNFDWHDVRFIGAIGGRYAMASRPHRGAHKAPVYACRLCSVSTRLAVVVGPVVGRPGEDIIAHFDGFGLLRGCITRQLPSGFVMDLRLNATGREKLGRKIVWHKKHFYEQLEDRREHKRIQLREPRTVVTLGDGTQMPGFVIDVSSSGIALSTRSAPPLGTPLAVGRLVGRVARILEVGFAVKFLASQDIEEIETLIVPPQLAPITAADGDRA